MNWNEPNRKLLNASRKKPLLKKLLKCNLTRTHDVLSKSLLKLNPFFCKGVLRVGGRLQQSAQLYDVKHPIILPTSSHVTKLIIEDHHRTVGHSGTSFTWTSLRQKYWIIRGAAAVRKIIGKCTQCKKRNAKPLEQIMADLPEERFAINKPPFYNTGTNSFGPFFIK